MADMKPRHETSEPSLVAEANYTAYCRLRDTGHSAWVKRAARQSDFYLGNQWTAEDLARLEDENRPAITVNAILSTVNTLLGEMVQNQADVHVKPERGGSEETAHYLNAIFQHTTHEAAYEHLEQQLYLDGLIEDRGFLDVRMDYQNNILGDISIALEDGTQVLIDSQARDKDPSTWSEVIITRWLTLDEIEVLYGAKKREEVASSVEVLGPLGDDSIDRGVRTFGDDTHYHLALDTDYDTINRVRVIERQHFRLGKTPCFIDQFTGDIREIPSHWSEEYIAMIAQANGYAVTELNRRRIRMTVSVDRILLSDDWSPYRSFTIVPFFPYFRRGQPLGVVANLISPQELLNKTSSQELHIINSTANSGWLVEENSLANMTEDELAENGAKTGIVISYRRGASKPPEKILANSLPTGIDRISMKASSNIREISGVNAAMAGAVGAHEVSGVAVREQTQRGQVQAIVPEESLKWTRRMLALKVIELAQDFYTEERIVYVADPLDPEQARQPVMVNAPDENGDTPYDINIGRYGVVIGTMPSRDTLHEVEFAQLMQMRAEGIQIPDHIIIAKSNLSNRQSLAKFIQDMQGFGELTPEQQQQQELEMQLQMRQVEAEIAGLEQKADELRSRSALNQAKAESLEGFNQMQIELAKLEAQISVRNGELDLRKQLADLSYNGQLTQNHRNNATKLATAMLQAQRQAKDSKTTPKANKK